MAKKPNASANPQLCLGSAKASAVGHSLGSSFEEINAVAARVIERVVGTSSDANHAAFGHWLLLFVFTTEGFHVGVDPTTSELKAKLLSAAGGE